MQNTPKRNSFFIPEGKYAINTTAANPRAVEQEAAVLLAERARESFYGLVPLDTTTEEDTRAAALTLAKGILASGTEMLVFTPYRGVKTLWNLADDRMAKGNDFWRLARQAPKGLDNRQTYEWIAQRLPDWEKRYEAARERSLKSVQLTRAKQERFLRTMHLTQDEKDNPYIYMFGSAAGSLGASVLGGIYFKAPKAISMLFGLNQAQNLWEEATENGVPRAKAAATALLGGAAETLLEGVGLGRLEKALDASKGIKRILGSALTEFLQEGSQQSAEELIMQSMGGRVQQAMDTFKSIALSATMGGLLGTGVGGIKNVYWVGVEKLKKLGAPDQVAQDLAAHAVQTGLSPEMTEESARLAEDQENPVNWPDNDIIKGQEALRAAAKKRDFAKEYNGIETRSKAKFKASGLSEEEAALGAVVETNIVKMQAAHLGLTPELAEQSLDISFNQELSESDAKIRFIGEVQTLSRQEQEAFYKTSKMNSYQEMLGELNAWRGGLNENGETAGEDAATFEQAAAMYKSPHKEFAQFYAAAQNNAGKKQSYYTFTTQDGLDIDIPSDTILHNKKHPEMTAAKWQELLNNIDNIEVALALKNKKGTKYKGQPVLLKINGANTVFGVVAEIADNGRVLITTAFESMGKKGVDAWLAEEERGAGTPDAFIFNFRLTTDTSRRATTSSHPQEKSSNTLSQNGTVIVGNSNINSLADIVHKIKGQEKNTSTFYQGVHLLNNFDDNAPAAAFVANRNGQLAHGIIDQELAASAGIAPGEIRVYNSLKKHLEEVKSGERISRLEQLHSLGYDNIIDFIDDVMDNLSSIQLGSNNSLLLTGLLKGKYNNTVAVRLEEENGYYKVTTVIARRKKGNKKTVWEAALPLRDEPGHPAFVGPNGTISIAPKEEFFKRGQFNQGTRGKTAITSKDGFIRAVITAGQAADQTTFMHEMAHIYLTAFQHVYGMEEYAAARKRLDGWLGKPRGGVYSRAQQEKFAQGFEQFLKEGKAPAPYLKSIFEKFRAWIIGVYNGADISKLSAAAREAYADMLKSESADAQQTVEFYQNAKKDFGRIRATLDKIKQDKLDVKDLQSVDLAALRDFIGILKKPAPALPKRHLLTDLRRYGAQYANANQIDKEAYKNARVYDKDTGVGDKPADWLVKHDYMEDADVQTYEQAQARDAEACDLIERALSGEPIYKLEDRPRVELHDAYMQAVNMAEDAIGADYKNYEKLLASLDALKKQGYRAVEKSDLDFIQEKFEELANLRESEEFLDREDGFGRVDDAKRGSADERRKEKTYKARLENLRKAQGLKIAVLGELEKRQLFAPATGEQNANTNQLTAAREKLQSAKTVEEIYKAGDQALSVIEDAYANTEEGRAEAGRMAPPAQDWDARRVELLKDIAAINQHTDANAAWAFAAIEREGLIVPHKNGITPAEWNAPAPITDKQRKMNVWKAEQILDEQLRNRYYKAFEKALGRIEGLKGPQKSLLLREFNNIRYRNKNAPQMIVKTLELAREFVEKNYKNYMAGKIEEIVKTPLFEKSGSLRTAKYSPAAQAFLSAAHRIMSLDTQTAQDSYARAVENQNYDEALTKTQILQNRLLQLKAAPESMTPADVKELYDQMRGLQRAGRDEVRLEKFIRNTREDMLRERLIDALAKQKMVKGAVTYALKLANWQSLVNTLFGEIEVDAIAENNTVQTQEELPNNAATREEIKKPQSIVGTSGKTSIPASVDIYSVADKEQNFNPQTKIVKRKIRFMDALSLEQNQIQMQNHVRRLREQVVARVGQAYGIKNGNEYIKKINELQSETFALLNYGEIPEGPAELLTERQRKPFRQTITKLELMFFYIQNQNPLNRARLMRAYRQEQYEQMFAPLCAEDKKAAAALMQIAQSTYDQMNEVHKRERGFALGRVENYFPNRTERLTGGLDYLREMLAANAAPSAIKARVQTINAVEKAVNPISLLMGEISRNAEYIYGAESAGKLRRVFRDKQMARALEEKFGKQDGRAIYEHIIKMIDLNGPAARIEQQGAFFETGEFLFNNWVKSAIGLKPIVAIKQFASAFNYAENMPVSAWTRGFKDALSHPKKTLAFMREFSPYLVTRYEEGGMNETLGRALAQDEVFGAADKINTLTNAITVNVRLGDMFALAFGGKPYVDWLMKEKGYSKEAAREAFELATVRSQQANLKSTLNEAQLNGGNLFWRAAWAFRNQQMQYARKLFDAYVDYKNGHISGGEMGKKVFMYALVQPALYTLLSLAWFAPDDDDRKDDYWRLAASPLEQTLGAVPFGDDAAQLLFNNLRSLCEDGKLTGLRAYELPGVADMYSTFNKLVRNFNSGDANLNDWLDCLAEIGQFSGFGTKQLKTQIGGVKDLATGKGAKGALKIIGYTENRASKVTGEKE